MRALDPPIELTRELTRQDVHRALSLVQRGFLLRAALAGSCAMLIVGGLLGLSIREADPASANGILAICGLSGPAVYLVYAFKRWYVVRRTSKLKIGFFTPQRTRLDADGLVAETDDSETRIAWSHFRRMKACDHVVVLFNEQGAWVFVARSRFDDDTDWDRFVTFANGRGWS